MEQLCLANKLKTKACLTPISDSTNEKNLKKFMNVSYPTRMSLLKENYWYPINYTLFKKNRKQANRLVCKLL